LAFLETQLKMFKELAGDFTKVTYPGYALTSSLSPGFKLFLVEDFHNYFSKTMAILPKECLGKIMILYRMLETQQKMLNNIIANPSLQGAEPYKNMISLRKYFEDSKTLDENIDAILGRMIYFLHTFPLESIIKFTTDCIYTGYYALASLNEFVLKEVSVKSNYENKGREYETISDNLSKENAIKYKQFIADLKEIAILTNKLMGKEYPDLWRLKSDLFEKEKYLLTK